MGQSVADVKLLFRMHKHQLRNCCSKGHFL